MYQDRKLFWLEYYAEIEQFLEENQRFPHQQSSNPKEAQLAKWLHNKRSYFSSPRYNKSNDCAQRKLMRLFEKFQWKFWQQNAAKFQDFIKSTGKHPYIRAKDPAERKLAHWYRSKVPKEPSTLDEEDQSPQATNKGIAINTESRIMSVESHVIQSQITNKCKPSPDNDIKWHKHYDDCINFMIKRGKPPSVKVAESRQKFLGSWLAQQKYRIVNENCKYEMKPYRITMMNKMFSQFPMLLNNIQNQSQQPVNAVVIHKEQAQPATNGVKLLQQAVHIIEQNTICKNQIDRCLYRRCRQLTKNITKHHNLRRRLIKVVEITDFNYDPTYSISADLTQLTIDNASETNTKYDACILSLLHQSRDTLQKIPKFLQLLQQSGSLFIIQDKANNAGDIEQYLYKTGYSLQMLRQNKSTTVIEVRK